jgi:hypothetical protein
MKAAGMHFVRMVAGYRVLDFEHKKMLKQKWATDAIHLETI